MTASSFPPAAIQVSRRLAPIQLRARSTREGGQPPPETARPGLPKRLAPFLGTCGLGVSRSGNGGGAWSRLSSGREDQSLARSQGGTRYTDECDVRDMSTTDLHANWIARRIVPANDWQPIYVRKPQILCLCNIDKNRRLARKTPTFPRDVDRRPKLRTDASVPSIPAAVMKSIYLAVASALRRPPQIRLQLRSHTPPHQRTLRLPSRSIVQIHQEAWLPPFENSNRQPVPIEQTVTRQRR